MQELWDRLERYFAKYAPEVLGSLNPPCAMEQIRKAEAEMELQMPEDFVESLLVHNGQNEGGAPPIVPAEYCVSRGETIATFGEPLPLTWIVSGTIYYQQAVPGMAQWADHFKYDGPVRHDGDWAWIPFVDPGSGDQLAMDMNPGEGGNSGQVISVCHDPSELIVVAPSYRAWLSELVDRYESGRYYLARTDGGRLSSFDRLNPRNTKT